MHIFTLLVTGCAAFEFVHVVISAVREGHGAMVRAWRFVDVVAHGRFRTPLGAGFSDISCFSLLNNLGHSFEVVSSGKAHHPQMLHLTQVKMSTW